jgi:hypothetical protein
LPAAQTTNAEQIRKLIQSRALAPLQEVPEDIKRFGGER